MICLNNTQYTKAVCLHVLLQCHHISVTASQNTDNSTVYSTCIQEYIADNSKAPWGIHRWSIDSPHKRSLMRQIFPAINYVLLCPQGTFSWTQSYHWKYCAAANHSRMWWGDRSAATIFCPSTTHLDWWEWKNSSGIYRQAVWIISKCVNHTQCLSMKNRKLFGEQQLGTTSWHQQHTCITVKSRI